ncbi:SpvB/TcaC N-terminal domain-containing protein [Algoriphagus sp. A40]|uniref:SpvB/TcaC N-terminal domain-containing protein n=1 Tax=Algoriphagus sp. A40 TaxID=1945863 RepID=UPI0009857A2B|nr:SpvB/TcaC N-terminal domain-containing protein [Algoriphagus sp. A40]OOG77104.1 hypothetical protein B0E43_05760 [Algoriphagus sp. A40]
MDAKSEKRQFFDAGGGKANSNAIEVPSISLPKGGGAIKGIDEKFSVNAVNGTASFSIPLPFSPARGASPSLSLSYNSGAGNEIFGLGWNLSLGSIKRKTDKGLPQYHDSIDSDTFLFSEAEDLVPEFKQNPDGSFQLDSEGDYIINERPSTDGSFTIRKYKPRIEGLFARIERWTENANDRIKWRVITKENTTTLFGWSDDAVVSNPIDAKKIYEWLPEFVFDDKGNCSQYIYKKEDEIGFEETLLHHRNRVKSGVITYTNLYLEKVLYGNQTPFSGFGNTFPVETDYFFQTVFDYGTLKDDDSFDVVNEWDFRADAFSDYKAGFEIRTTRLCKRVLLFHHFTGINEYEGLVKSINFEYGTSAEQDFTFLKKITSYGYIKKLDGTYSHKKLPPMEFEYQKHDWNRDVKTISTEDLVHAPVGLDDQQYQFTDLFNEGLSGILTEQANGWYYKHNLGGGQFEHAKLVSPKPSFAGLGTQMQLADLDADGGIQLVSFDAEPRGYFELVDDNEWHGLRSFKALPSIDFGDANTRMLDLNGDGKPDVMISEDQVFTWYPSEGKNGYSAARKTSKPFDEEEGPHIVFADAKQTIFLADMSGDGMTDIVRIRNGEVCYWPNLGYGKFGAKVALDNAPIFDHPDAFNPAYLRLADIDGSGTSDIIYLGKNKFTCWKNLSGNSFGTTPFEIDSFPEIHSNSKITVTDLLGNGVACIVWSSQLAKDVNIPLKYIDLMNSKKPHIMVSYKNNLGKEVSLVYTPSTKFYIEDKLAGNPWITKLHFPVHLLSKTTVADKWTKTRFTSQYSYHHGYYDHAEREFRGFGRVEQTDAEDFGVFAVANANSPYITDDLTLYQPPIKTITWFHTGAFLGRDKILNQFQTEYFAPQSPDFSESKLSEPNLDADGLSPQEWPQALRACKGMTLRQEVYELEVEAFKRGEEKRIRLYSTAFHNSKIHRVQPKGNNPFAVFFPAESEAITYQYELDLTNEVIVPDPRIAHSFNLNYDAYGNMLESLAVTYPRIGTHAEAGLAAETLALIQEVQRESLMVFSKNSFSNDILEENTYRLRVPTEAKTFEVTGIFPADGYYFSMEEIRNHQISDVVGEIPYQMLPNRTSPQKRCVEHFRILYFADDLENSLPWGAQSTWGLPYETYTLALTTALISAVFKPGQLTPGFIQDLNDAQISGYLSGTPLQERFPDINTAGQYWIRSGIAGFHADAAMHFFLPERYTDPFGNITGLRYDDKDLFIEAITDPIGNVTRVENFNFRVLAPQRMIDINDNIAEVVFDILGMPTATALMGKGDEADHLTDFDEALIHPALETVIPYFTEAYDEAVSRNLLGNATGRSLYYFGEQIEADGSITYGHHPACAAGIVREKHLSQEGETQSPLQVGFEYSDGSGNAIVTKKQAEPERDGLALRWLANGKTILNNKGKPVKQYEPYFSPVGHQYEEPIEFGVTPILFYDAAGRQIRTEMPDGTYSRVEFTPWLSTVWDANDTVLEPNNAWYLRNIAGTVAQQRAASLAAAHANTPAVVHVDGLGREVISIAHNRRDGVDEKQVTFSKLDTEGKPLWIQDARGNRVMEYINTTGAVSGYVPCYDIAGNLLFHHSMDAGDRWMIMDSTRQPFYAWDENEKIVGTDTVQENKVMQSVYDVFHRPIEVRLKINEGEWQVIERLVYGESLPDAASKNLKAQIYQHYDSGGLITNELFDFKGNLLEATRQLTTSYDQSLIDWNIESPIPEIFTQSIQYDALNRMVFMENWHLTGRIPSTYKPTYNQRGVLKSEIHTVNGIATTVVRNIEYNAKGQRTRMQYGNGTTTRYHYDALTFRLMQLRTTRNSPGETLPNAHTELRDPLVLQNLYYTYDPSGNITEILDDAYEPVFFNNQRVEPRNRYSYDALYQLIQAEGRENGNLDQAPKHGQSADMASVSFPINDPNASRNYIQEYRYDAVGNILQMKHRAGIGGFADRWTRQYTFATDSNRLLSTQTGDVASTINYSYDTHGSMLNLGNGEEEYRMQWDYREMIHTINLGGGGQAFYNYDTTKQRCRKRIERPGGVIEERIYLGGMELYRRWNGADLQEEIETHHLFVGDQRILIAEHIITTNNNQLSTGLVYRYQYSNHLGSVGLECDGGGSIISYEEYHPYGTSAYQAKNAAITTTAKRYKYTGMERDEESGMAYHSARYYLNWLGRWLSADPIGIKGGMNLYVYVESQPIHYTDHSGREKKFTDQEWADYVVKAQAELANIRQDVAAMRAELKAMVDDSVEKLRIAEADAAAARTKAKAAIRKADAAQASYDKAKTRVSGVGQTLIGLGIAALNCPFVEVGIGIPGCVFGIDNAVTGVKKGISGEDTATATERSAVEIQVELGVDQLEAERNASNFVDLVQQFSIDLPSYASARYGNSLAGEGDSNTSTTANVESTSSADYPFVIQPGDKTGKGAAIYTIRGNSISWETETNAVHVASAIRQQLAQNPKIEEVLILSGTHGDELGNTAISNPTYAEPIFYWEDVATSRALHVPTRVYNAPYSDQVSRFHGKEATSSPRQLCVRAYCFSSNSSPGQ